MDINKCEKCKGPVKIVACIEDTLIIKKILSHLKQKQAKQTSSIARLAQPRAPPLLPTW